MLTWTETPLVEMWGQLRYLASPANVYNLLSGRTKSSRSTAFPESKDLVERSEEIASCVRQADEYYQAASRVSLVTHPLLQFYGAQALAKATILANDTRRKLSDLKYHGLSTRASTAPRTLSPQLQTYSEDPAQWQIEREFGVSNEGIFPLLCSVVGDVVPPISTVFTLKELFKTVPDLAVRFFRHYGEFSNCYYLSTEPSTNQEKKLVIHFNTREDLDHIAKLFPNLLTDFDKIPEGFLSKQPMAELPSYAAYEEGTVAGRYLVKPLEPGIRKSFSILFAGLFILSNIVRYKPRFWMLTIDGKTTGSVSIVEAFCSIANRRLPNDTLESIWKEKFVYATPGYFT